MNFSLSYFCLVLVSILEIAGYKQETSRFARVIGRVAGLSWAVVFSNSLFTDIVFYALLATLVPEGFLESLLNLSMHGPINMLILGLEVWLVPMPYSMSYITMTFVPILLYWLGWSLAFLFGSVNWLPYFFLKFTWALPVFIVAILLMSIGIHVICVKLIRSCNNCCNQDHVFETDVSGEKKSTNATRSDDVVNIEVSEISEIQLNST